MRLFVVEMIVVRLCGFSVVGLRAIVVSLPDVVVVIGRLEVFVGLFVGFDGFVD